MRFGEPRIELQGPLGGLPRFWFGFAGGISSLGTDPEAQSPRQDPRSVA